MCVVTASKTQTHIKVTADSSCYPVITALCLRHQHSKHLCTKTNDYINKITRSTFYVFILQSLYYSTFTVGTCSKCKAEQLGKFEWCEQTCRYGKSWTPDDEHNSLSKHVELYKDCRINTYKKCILSVCLYTWLGCTVHTMSNKTNDIFFYTPTISKQVILMFCMLWITKILLISSTLAMLQPNLKIITKLVWNLGS